jgi:hypothetical protein
MPENEVTLGEVGRRLGELLVEFREMRQALVGRAEYEADQEGIDRRFEESGKVHIALEARVATEGVAREAAVAKEATEREKDDARLEARIDRIGGWVKWGGGAAITVIVAVIGWILANGGGS